jgi:CBS domain containing-hemolysin-like protein
MTNLVWGWLAPLVTVICLGWASWLALAAEAFGDGKSLGDLEEVSPEPDPPLARRLHVAHLTLLFISAVAGGISLAWWTASGSGLVFRLGLVVALVWIVGDLIPRVVAVLEPNFARSSCRGALWSLPVFKPLYALVARADRHGRDNQVEKSDAAAALDGEPIRGLFSLAESTVADIMTPRVDIVAVDASATETEVEEILRQSEYARLPVFDGTPDAIVGLLYAKDLLKTLSESTETPEWQTLVRPAMFVPEGKRLDRQLQEFQRGRRHMALVVDEHGGTAGLVTLEDILEEIVGEIQDEYDVSEVAEIQDVDGTTWLVQGATPLSDLEAVVGLEFGRDDVSTVGGLMLAEFGRVPRAKEALLLAGCRLTVDQMVRRRVQRVLVHRIIDVETAGTEAGDT